MADLHLVHENSGDEAIIQIERLPLTIGRSAEADVRVVSSWASRLHCELYEHKGALAVRDMNSRHGVFVNGHPIRDSHLEPGDVLAVGLDRFVIRRAK